MSWVEIVVTNDDYWALALYTRHYSPVQIYSWLNYRSSSNSRYFTPAFEQCLSVSIQRRSSLRPPKPLVSLDAEATARTPNHAWTVVRIIGRCSQLQPETPANVFHKALHKCTPWGRQFTQVYSDDESAAYAASHAEVNPVYREKELGETRLSRAESEAVEECLSELREESWAWIRVRRACQSAVGPPTLRSVCEVGRREGVMGGHWTAYWDRDDVKANERAGKDWQRLLHSFIFGLLSDCPHVRGVSWKRTPDGTTVATSLIATTAVTHFDGHQDKAVFRVEKLLRLSGLFKQLKFKPDALSAAELTHHHRALRPTIYASRFEDELPLVSTIRTDYSGEQHTPEVLFHLTLPSSLPRHPSFLSDRVR